MVVVVVVADVVLGPVVVVAAVVVGAAVIDGVEVVVPEMTVVVSRSTCRGDCTEELAVALSVRKDRTCPEQRPAATLVSCTYQIFELDTSSTIPTQPEPPSVVAIATFVEDARDKETVFEDEDASVTSIPETDNDEERASGKEFWLVAYEVLAAVRTASRRANEPDF